MRGRTGVRHPSPPGHGRRVRDPVRLLVWPALLVAAWLVPALTHLARVDWLLIPLVVLGTASLSRASRSLLDRVVLAIGLLIGFACAAGLLFSVWPWHLAPYPVGVLALTGLVVVAAVTGRRPDVGVGHRWRGDLGVLAVALVPLAVAGRPFLVGGLVRRLSLVMLGEDLSRFYNAYDAIRAVGGYPFFHPDIGGVSLSARMVVYPTGSMFVSALLDSFVRSSSAQGTPTSAFTHFVGYFVVGFGLFGAATVWAADWVARPFLHGWRRVLVVCVAAAGCAFSALVTMVVSGFFSSMLGIALLALLFAILVRPPRVDVEYLVTVAALTVGLSFTYYVFLPAALAAVVCAAVSLRRRLRRLRPAVVATCLVAAPLVAVPVLVTYAGNPAQVGDQLVLPGTAIGTDYNATVGAVLAVLAGCALRWRLPLARRAAAVVLTMTGFTAAVGAYSVYRTGEVAHYFDKCTHALLVTCLVLFGVVASLLPGRDLAGNRERLVAVLAAATAFVGLGVVPLGHLTVAARLHAGGYGSSPAPQTSWGIDLALGRIRADDAGAQVVVRALAVLPQRYDRPTVVVQRSGNDVSYLATKFLSVLRRDGDSVDYWAGVPWQGRDAAHLVDAVRGNPTAHVRFVVVGMPEVAADLAAFARAQPRYGVQVVTLSGAG